MALIDIEHVQTKDEVIQEVRKIKDDLANPDYSSACKLIEERISGAKRSLKITVSQARHTPQTRWSDHPDAVPSVWGTRSDAMLSSQPSWASLSH